MTLREYLKTIADAIREKTNGTTTISASNFSSSIRGLCNFTDAKSASGNGYVNVSYYNPDEDGYNHATGSFSVRGIKGSDPGALYLEVDLYIDGASCASDTREFVLSL